MNIFFRRNVARSGKRSMTIYVETEVYNRIAKALAAIEPCPFAGRVTPDQIKIVLGEVADVWPMAILPTSEDGCDRVLNRHGFP
jgi:hypothetical protein